VQFEWRISELIEGWGDYPYQKKKVISL